MENFKVFLILQRVKISLGSLFLSSSSFFFKSNAANSYLAWRIPWTEEAGRLESMWSQRVRHD